MEKDFRAWHALKTELQNNPYRRFFAEREIWICSIGLNIGHEEDGKNERFLRPVVVFKKISSDEFWGIPLTSSERKEPFRYCFEFNGKTTTAILSQIRLLDGKRLLRRSGMMSEKAFFEMAKEFKRLIPQNEIPPEGGISRGAEAHGDSSLPLNHKLSTDILIKF